MIIRIQIQDENKNLIIKAYIVDEIEIQKLAIINA